MTQYVMNIIQPVGEIPPPEFLDKVMRGVNALIDDAKSAGVWVFNGALHPQSTATVLHLKDDEVLVTDGPYAESKEFVGGFVIIDVPDLDVALDWGRRLATVLPLPIEVRPFQDRG
jgi:hypothetical protein